MLCRLVNLWNCLRVGRRDPATRAATKLAVRAPRPMPKPHKTEMELHSGGAKDPSVPERGLVRPSKIEGWSSELSKLHSFDGEESTLRDGKEAQPILAAERTR